MLNGGRPFKWLLMMCNEAGKIMAHWGTESCSLKEVREVMKKVYARHCFLGEKVIFSLFYPYMS